MKVRMGRHGNSSVFKSAISSAHVVPHGNPGYCADAPVDVAYEAVVVGCQELVVRHARHHVTCRCHGHAVQVQLASGVGDGQLPATRRPVAVQYLYGSSGKGTRETPACG